MIVWPKLLDELLKGYETLEDLLRDGGILKQLTAVLVERCLNAEMKTHLEGQQAEPASQDKPVRNCGTGHSKRRSKESLERLISASLATATVSLNPFVKKGQARFDGFDDKVLFLYPRGMSTRDIQAQL